MTAKHKKPASDTELPADEAKRRALQRKAQALALKLRAEGGAYKPQKHKRKAVRELEHGSNAGKKRTGKAPGGKKDKKSKHDTPTWRPLKAADVVILPIYWNMHHEEKAKVIAAAHQAQELLQEAGISCTLDAANQYTPGQKMKYWETAGVRVRVELGPKEAATGGAVVARAGTPGTVAQKKAVNMAVQLVREVRAALAEQLGAGGQVDEAQEDGDDGGQGEADVAGVQAGGEDEEGAGGSDASAGEDEPTATTTTASTAHAKRQKREKAKAAKKAARDAAAGGSTVREGSRRDRKRKAKEAATAAATATKVPSEGGGADHADVQPPDPAPPAAQGGKQAKHDQLQHAAPGGSGRSGPEPVPAHHHTATSERKQKKAGMPGVQVAEPPQPASKAGAVQEGVISLPAIVVLPGGGDDLADDFAIDDAFLAEPEEDVLTLSKAARMKKTRKLEKQRRKQSKFAEGARAWDGEGGHGGLQPDDKAGADKKVKTKTNKPAAKVVVF